MFAESVHCQLGVAKGNRKVVPRTQTGYCEWSVAEGVVAALYDADESFCWSECPLSGFSNELAIVSKIRCRLPWLGTSVRHGQPKHRWIWIIFGDVSNHVYKTFLSNKCFIPPD